MTTEVDQHKHPPLRILIAGGGTGGHLFPAMAIAETFLARQPRSSVLFVGTGNPFERAALGQKGFKQARVRVEGIKGRGIWPQLRALFKLPRAVLAAVGILWRFKPNLVVGVGSYAAGPVIAAAWLMRKKIVLHEQNILPGITNRLLAPLARRIFVSFEHTATRFKSGKVEVSGNPVRQEILAAAQSEALESAPGAAKDRPFTILVLGGSQGAHSINMAVIDALGHLQQKERFYMIHQTGAQDENLVKGAYTIQGINCRVQSFFRDMAEPYRRADLIICRAGATTVAEITALGKAAVLVPYPYAADDHQALNARTLASAGAAEIILEQNLDPAALAAKMEQYADDEELLKQMRSCSRSLGRPHAAETIATECQKLVQGPT